MKKHNNLMLVIAFLLPLFILVAAFAALRLTPFGQNTLIFGDSNGYYINYLSYLRDALQGKHSLYYSFTKAIGGSIAHLTSFFFMRPDILLYAVAGWNYLPEAFSISVMINTALCGLTMYILLADLFGYKKSNLIFSTSYALMGFLTAYNYIIVFTITVIMFPLVVLGIRKIIRGESAVVYVLALGYSIASHFQMGFIACYSSAFVFVALLFIDENARKNIKRIISQYVFSSLLSGMIGAAIWLPALFALIGGRASQRDAADFEFVDNAPILQMASRFFSGASSASQLIDGLPVLFCGIIPVFLVILYFLDDNNNRKEKKVAIGLLAIYILSFYIKAINSIFHGFGHANWFNYRQSFVFCFIVLVIAARQLEQIETASEKNIRRAFGIVVIAVVIILFQKYEFVGGGNVTADILILVIAVAAILFHRTKPEKADYKSLVYFLLICTCLQMYLNYYTSVHKVIKEWGDTKDEFNVEVAKRQPVYQSIRESDTDFYRMESEDSRSGAAGNDPMMFDYYGVGHTSYEKDFVNRNLSRLGIGWHGIQSNYYDKGITASMDSFLGLRYLISKRDLSLEKGYIALGEVGENTIYRNPYALPIAIVSDSKVSEVSLESDKDIFELQNQIWKGMTGETDSLFTREESFNVAVHNPTENVEMTSGEVLELAELLKISDNAEQESSEKESLEQDNPEDIWKDSKDDNTIYDEVGNEVYPNNAYIEISFPAQMSGPVYMYDSAAVVDNYGTSEDVLKYLGNYEIGDTVTGRIYYNYNVDKVILADTVRGLYVYYADMEKLSKYSQILQSRPVTITKEKDTILTGNADIQDGDILLFTIPYDEGWSLYVDGQKAQIDKTMDLLMSAAVTPGQHNYELRYTAPGLKLGVTMSIVAAVITLIQFVLYRRGRVWAKSDQVEE